MIYIGIFAKTFSRPTLEETLDAVVAHGIRAVQFNMSCVGLDSLPGVVDPTVARGIRSAFSTRELSMTAVSGTFNMIHPDRARRREGLRCFAVLASACKGLGTSIVTLSTGTRDPEDMWRRHPDNHSRAAWKDLVTSMSQAVQIAEDAGITLAFEPEVSNVVDSARKGRRLLDEVRSPRLKVVMDPSNLFHTGELPRMHHILEDAFDLLGPDVVLAHAKDLTHDGEAGQVPAGRGVLDYDRYMAHLTALGRDLPLILHALPETQVDSSVAFLRAKGAHLAPPSRE